MEGEGLVDCYRGWEVPRMLLLGFSIPDQHRKDIIQQESLGTDML